MTKHILIALLFMLTACVHIPNMTQGPQILSTHWVTTNVIKGTTSRDAIVSHLGNPSSVYTNADLAPNVKGTALTLEQPPAVKSKTSALWFARIPDQLLQYGYRTVYFTAYFDDSGTVVDYSIIENM